MSLAGIVEFNKNLLRLMDSKGFKEGNDVQRLELGYALLNSKYGLGKFLGFGSVEELPEKG